MKNIFKTFPFALALGFCLVSCDDDTVDEQHFNRLFTPTSFSEVSALTDGVRLEWAEVKGATSYTVEVAPDSSFSEIRYKKENIEQNYCEFLGLGLRQHLVARVCANSTEVASSKYLISPSFTTRPYVSLQEVLPKEVTLSKATLHWTNDYPFTHLCYYKQSESKSEGQKIALSAEQIATQEYQLTGLAENTEYIAYMLNENAQDEGREHNTVKFKTKLGANAGDIVMASCDTISKFLDQLDLAEDKPIVIYIQAGATINNISSEGSALNLVLKRNITFRGAPEGDQPVFNMKEIQIEGEFDSVRFENLHLTSANSGTYMINLKSAYKHVGKIVMSNCEISQYKNSILRHQGTAGTTIGKIEITDCLIHDMNSTGSNSYALLHFANKKYFCDSFVFTNSTFYNCGSNIIEMRNDGTADTKSFDALINQCTFNNIGLNTRKMFDFQSMNAGKFMIKNTVFGKIGNSDKFFGFLGIGVTTEYSGNYMTSDFKFAVSTATTEATRPVDLVFTSTECTADELFVNPSEGDFSYQAGKAVNAGDMRWR